MGMGKDADAPLPAFVSCSKHELVTAYLTDLVSTSGSISLAQSTLMALQYFYKYALSSQILLGCSHERVEKAVR